MTDHAIFVTAHDAEKLQELIRNAQRGEYRKSKYLEMLSGELARATIIDAGAVPPDVIIMNSQAILIDIETGEEMVLTLVFPEDADPIEGKTSILAPIGTAMLGYRVGDVFEWETPGGMSKIRVEKVISRTKASDAE